MESKRWLSIPEAALYLSVTERAIRNLILDGRLARARIGKRFICDARALDRVMEASMEREVTPD